jgi:hypothetical protein
MPAAQILIIDGLRKEKLDTSFYVEQAEGSSEITLKVQSRLFVFSIKF